MSTAFFIGHKVWLNLIILTLHDKTMANLKHLDLNLLRVFDTLMDERNVSRAAERLSVSQPAVSGMLTRLIDSLDDPLFIRGQHGMIPTERALELAAPIKKVLQDIDQIVTPVEFIPQEAHFTVTIAATDYALQVILTPFLKQLSLQAPHIKVDVRMIQDSTVQEQMERGLIDFALMTPNTAPPSLRAKTLFQEDYVCVVRQKHPTVQGDAMDLDTFCRLDHALVSYSGGAFSGATDQALETLNRQRNVMVSMPSFLSLAELIRSTDFCAVVPKRLAEGQPSLKQVALPFQVEGFTKVLVWHERTHHQAAFKWLRALIYDTCQSFDIAPLAAQTK